MMDGIISIEFYNDLSSIIESSRKSAYQMVDRILVIRNWLLGKRIAEKEQLEFQRKSRRKSSKSSMKSSVKEGHNAGLN